VAISAAAAGDFHGLHPHRDVFLGELREGLVAQCRADVVLQVCLVLVDDVLLDAGQVVDVVADPLGDGQRWRDVPRDAFRELDALHRQGLVGGVCVDGRSQRLGGPS
jgi:hypothetical protein